MSVPAVPDFVLLSGFLGSGKTTLLLDALDEPSLAGTGVIVNEVGAINIDGATIAAKRSDLKLAMLSNGCVCCSMMSDLPMTVAALLDEVEAQGLPPLERLVLETSGLSRPGPILRQLQGMPVPFRVRTVTTYDAGRGALDSANHDEALAQLAAAQIIVLTKTDRVAPEALPALRRTMAGINPLARIVDLAPGPERALAAFAGPTAELGEMPAPDSAGTGLRHGGARTFYLRLLAPAPVETLLEWFDNLAAALGPRLLRIKAILDVEKLPEPLLLQSVGTVFEPPRRMPAGTADRGMVIIARNVSAEEILATGPALPLIVVK